MTAGLGALLVLTGGLTPLAVPAAALSGAQGPQASITANDQHAATVAYGSDVTIVWSARNVNQCGVTPGNLTGLSGSTVLANVTDSSTFKLYCSGQSGTITTYASFWVQPPTFDYLRSYLVQSATKYGTNPSNVKGMTEQLTQAETDFDTGDKAGAQNLADLTILNTNKLAQRSKFNPVAASDYMKAVNTMVGSWYHASSPDPTPDTVIILAIINGGYPAKWNDVPMDSVIDDWGMYNRECVSYTAYKVSSSNRFMPYWGGAGNANQWPSDAQAMGMLVDSTPRAGDVAISMRGAYGHAMYVESVNGDGTINISQYNALNTGTYSTASNLSPANLSFIHF